MKFVKVTLTTKAGRKRKLVLNAEQIKMVDEDCRPDVTSNAVITTVDDKYFVDEDIDTILEQM